MPQFGKRPTLGDLIELLQKLKANDAELNIAIGIEYPYSDLVMVEINTKFVIRTDLADSDEVVKAIESARRLGSGE